MRQWLEFCDYEIWVHLGCDSEEQKHPQPVIFNLVLDFADEVAACRTDELRDAVDYTDIAATLKAAASAKVYRLVEHLNHQALEAVAGRLRAGGVRGTLRLSVRKLRVPIEHLRNGVVFSCEIKL